MINVYRKGKLRLISEKELNSLSRKFKRKLFTHLIFSKHKFNIDYYLDKIDKVAEAAGIQNKEEFHALLLLSIGVKNVTKDLDNRGIEALIKPAGKLTEENIFINHHRVFWSKLKKKIKILLYVVKNKIDEFKKKIDVKSEKKFKQVNIKKRIRKFNKGRTENAKEIFCCAPYTQLYFSFDGKIIICCQNRNFVLGNYPNDNIHELWFSERLKEFKNDIKNSDFDKAGCIECRDPLLQGNFNLVPARFFYDNYAEYVNNKYPVLFEFETSNTCNLSCTMCTGFFSSSISECVNPSEGKKVDVYDDGFIAQIKPFIPHLKYVIFKGGEPFLIREYYKIWDAILEINPSVKIRVITNGTVLNDRIKNMLERSDVYLNLSIDSFKKETYEQIRRGATFEKTMDHMHYFIGLMQRKEQNIMPRLILNVCVMTINRDELGDILAFCNKNKIVLMLIFVTGPFHLTLKNLGPVTLSRIIMKLSEIKSSPFDSITNYNKFVFDNLLTKTRQWKSEAEKRDLFGSINVVLQNVRDYVFSNHKKADAEMLQKKFEYYNKIIDDIVTYTSQINPYFYKMIIEIPVSDLITTFETASDIKTQISSIEERYNYFIKADA